MKLLVKIIGKVLSKNNGLYRQLLMIMPVCWVACSILNIVILTQIFIYSEYEEEVTDYPSTTEAYVTNSSYFNETDTTESSDIDETTDEAENDNDYSNTALTEGTQCFCNPFT